MSIRADVRRGVAEALRWVRDHLTEEVGAPVDEGGTGPSPGAEGPVVRAAGAVSEAAAPAADALPLQEEVQAEGPAVEAAPLDPRLHDAIIEALQTIFDPEIPVDIYNLGLIYGVEIREDRTVDVRMTLTSPNCPSAQALPEEVQLKVEAVDGVQSARVDVVWEPPWTPDLMSEEARLELNV